jgi:hypothetical protein
MVRIANANPVRELQEGMTSFDWSDGEEFVDGTLIANLV